MNEKVFAPHCAGRKAKDFNLFVLLACFSFIVNFAIGSRPCVCTVPIVGFIMVSSNI